LLTKILSASGGQSPPDPLTRGFAPGPHWGCAPDPLIGSRSALAIWPPPLSIPGSATGRGSISGQSWSFRDGWQAYNMEAFQFPFYNALSRVTDSINETVQETHYSHYISVNQQQHFNQYKITQVIFMHVILSQNSCTN
jgi:hypothetical protein